MREFLSSKAARVNAAVMGVVFAVVAPAAALAQTTPDYDLSPISTGFKEQVQSALATGLPIAAGLLALSVGIVWVRKLMKAK
ncbi:MAG TPA: hypothetical protein VF069_27530 [Streptosporangiaceae bacterium]